MSDDKQPGRTEIIRWRDARSEDAWTEQEDIEMHAADITTVGFVAGETHNLLCIASSWERRTNQFCGMMFIPKECILDRRYLNPAEEEIKGELYKSSEGRFQTDLKESFDQ